MCQNTPGAACDTKNILVEHMYGTSENPAKIKLMKMSKGYQWEVSLSGSDFTDIFDKVKKADQMVREVYGDQPKGNSQEA